MSIQPLIYSNIKQVSFDFEDNESGIVTLSVSASSAGYRWSFPQNDINSLAMSGSPTDSTISVKLLSYSPLLRVVWAKTNALSSDPYDIMDIIVREYTPLAPSGSPSTLYETITLPNPLSECLVGVNEFGESSTINTVIRNLNNNLEYLIQKSEYAELSPTTIFRRYGLSNSSETSTLSAFHWTQINTNYADSSYFWELSPTTPKLSATHISSNGTDLLYVTNANTLNIMSMVSGYNPQVDSIEFPLFSSAEFINIKSVHLEINGIIWVLEGSGRISKLFYDGNWKYLKSWNSTDGSMEPIINPTKMGVDNINAPTQLYVIASPSDTTPAKQVHVFDINMLPVGIISDSTIATIIGVAKTRDYIVVADDSDTLFFFDDTYPFTLQRTIGIGGNVKNFYADILGDGKMVSLYNCQDNYFFYIQTDNLIFKYTQDGAIAGFTGVNAAGIVFDKTYTNYQILDMCHDNNNNLHACSTNDIITYFDKTDFNSKLLWAPVIPLSVASWAPEQLLIGSNENCSYLVYNRIFSRLWENINIHANHIFGKLVLTNGEISIVGFKLTEFTPIPYKKHEIYVGINELHCEAAINRNIRKLYTCLEAVAKNMSIVDFGTNSEYILTDTIEFKWNGEYTFDGGLTFNGYNQEF
jgi:hypothetical protein